MKMTRHLLLVSAVSLMFAACGSKDGSNSGGGAAQPAATPDPTLSTPKGSLAYQLELLKAGDIEKLRECIRPVRRYMVSQRRFDDGRAKFAGKTLEDLWGDESEWVRPDGVKVLDVGRKGDIGAFASLMLEDGQWRSDRIWFAP